MQNSEYRTARLYINFSASWVVEYAVISLVYCGLEWTQICRSRRKVAEYKINHF